MPKKITDKTLTSAATLIQAKKTSSATAGLAKNSESGAWQEDAWNMYDLVGELRFVVNSLSGQLAKARLYVATLNANGDIVEAENSKAQEALRNFGEAFTDTSQLLKRIGQNLMVAGEGWLAGVPPLDDNGKRETWSNTVFGGLDWHMLSTSEVSRKDNKVTLHLTSDAPEEFNVDEVHLIRVHNPHPRKFYEATSPVRSALPILKELVGLTMHISAQVDSRLAGAGLLVVPQSARQQAQNTAANLTYGAAEPADQFVEDLIDTMIEPIADRAAASAVVPLVVSVPDGSTGQFQYLNFSSGLDAQAESLREESIRRLALSMDAPPEVLLGNADMNHWSAWLVDGETVDTHLAPLLALIVDALTQKYLWYALEDAGVPDAEKYFVWYKTDNMISRPNRGSDALALHERGLLSAEATRDANGFAEEDSDPVATMVLHMIAQTPALVAAPGVAELYEQVKALMDGNPATLAPAPAANVQAPQPAQITNPVTVPESE